MRDPDHGRSEMSDTLTLRSVGRLFVGAGLLGALGAVAGLVFLGVTAVGGDWYGDTGAGWFDGHWWWIAVAAGVWWYNPRYILGLIAPGDLPLEEVLFFVVIPLCGVLTYSAVDSILSMLSARRAKSRGPR